MIVVQGTKADKMFFLAKGDCDVYVLDENKENKLVTILQSGRHFGEVALIQMILSELQQSEF